MSPSASINELRTRIEIGPWCCTEDLHIDNTTFNDIITSGSGCVTTCVLKMHFNLHFYA